jgi:hypothetical protein
MQARLLFWIVALANMAAIVAFAVRGVRAIRAGDVAVHRRSMTTAAWLVGAFLAAYVAKRFVIGPEDLSVWSRGALWNLRIHESFVALMLLAGGCALRWGLRIGRTSRATGDAADPAAPPPLLRRHRSAGWLAVLGAAFGLATACGILAGMLGRA